MLVSIKNITFHATYTAHSPCSRIARSALSRLDSFPPDLPRLGSMQLECLVDGSPFACTLDLQVAEGLPADIILGADWHLLLVAERSQAHPDTPQAQSSAFPHVPKPQASPVVVAEERRDGPRLPTHAHSVDPPDLSPEPAGSVGLSILHDNIFSCNKSRSRISVFDSDIVKVQHLMDLHGLRIPSDSILECRRILLSHLLTGACVEFGNHGPNGAHTACRRVSEGVAHANDLTISVLAKLGSVVSDVLATDRLEFIASCLGIHAAANDTRRRSTLQRKLRAKVTILEAAALSATDVAETFNKLGDQSRSSLIALCSLHGVPLPPKYNNSTLRKALFAHFDSGSCQRTSSDGCHKVCLDWQGSDYSSAQWDIFFLSSILKSARRDDLREILQTRGVTFDPDDGTAKLRRTLKKHIHALQKGKGSKPLSYAEKVRERLEHEDALDEVRAGWPKIASKELKDRLIRDFRQATSSDALRTFSCNSCAADRPLAECTQLSQTDFDLDLFLRPDLRMTEDGWLPAEKWLDSDPMYHPPLPTDNHATLKDLVLFPPPPCGDGEEEDVKLSFCKSCVSAVRSKKIPPLSLANRNYLGEVPDELKELTVVEEAMIARCRAKCWIIQLKEETGGVSLPTMQRGMKGHIVIYPQRPSRIAQLLPPSLDEITEPICVLFVGSKAPTQEWLRDHAKPLTVRPQKVRAALKWLQIHNRLYKEVIINENVLQSMPETYVLPVQIEHILPSDSDDSRTSRYDAPSLNSLYPSPQNPVPSTEVVWENVVISDIGGKASSNDLREAALKHVKAGGGYVKIPHDPEPENEFMNPELFPLIYPTLFPYGMGGLQDKHREAPLSMARHIKHVFQLSDRRFQEHYSFLFTAFNMLQRHSMLLHTKLKTKKSNFTKMSEQFASVSPQSIHTVVERMSRGDYRTSGLSKDEKKVFSLMQEVTAITTHVPGSVAARMEMRNEIRGLMIDQGLPSFYITINPADVFSPVLRFLAGEEIDVDNLLPEHAPDYWKQSILVAKNPAAAARFFNVYMKAFISCLLRHDPSGKDLEGGIFGVVKAYYGCVEAQGRGTLHCHMLVWLEGGLNPDEIKRRVVKDPTFQQRLLAYLEDNISNSIPEDPLPSENIPSSIHNPCSVRGLDPSAQVPQAHRLKQRQKDMHFLAQQCQWHQHSKTCYKYWKGPGHPKECRFNLDPSNFHPKSTVDPETGEIHLRCLDGLVNNFTETILEAIRCNMDIKFIGSGASAKAILYYITDYITKSQLKAHVAYAALELAIKKLGEYVPNEDDLTVRSKQMLQKCAYALISHQELSAQQVASYLMDYGDHFTSHKFSKLFWTLFESTVDHEIPSPECYTTPKPGSTPDMDNTPVPAESMLNQNEDPGDQLEMDPLATVDDTEQETVEEESRDDPEVAIVFDNQGTVHASVNAVSDYCARGLELDNVCVWDFVARVKKVTKKSVESKKKPSFLDDEENEEEDLGLDSEDIEEEEVEEPEDILDSIKRARPRVALQPGHKQADSHVLYVLHPDSRVVPVPCGPGLPRRDREETAPKFKRLMLILFKPWRSPQDLKLSTESWTDAYDAFMRDCPDEFMAKMNNMQVLHECKDSRDDHFANRHLRPKHPTARTGSSSHVDDDFSLGSEESQREILEHLLELKDCRSHKNAAGGLQVMECLQYANASGMYSLPHGHQTSTGESHTNDATQLVSNTTLEDKWQQQYESRRDIMKKRATAASTTSSEPVAGSSGCLDEATATLVDDGAALRAAFLNDDEPMEPVVFEGTSPTDQSDAVVSVDEMIERWTLNTEQARAFRMVAEHSLKKNPEQLRMFVSGPGGTGKSRVIDALTDFFRSQNQERRVRLAAFTGVAARNIGGMTLHAALGLAQFANRKKSAQSQGKRDLIAMWRGVDYLVIDEVSMVGCGLLHDVHRALCNAKENTNLFGGVNIIFAGDFAQLPPVLETKLYSKVGGRAFTKVTKQTEKALLGKLLWMSVQTVIVLSEVRRQSGAENRVFVELLGRLRRGACTASDYVLLQRRLITNCMPDWADETLQRAPILVSENKVKDKLNDKGAEVFAARSGEQLHWYYASDSRGGSVIDDPDLLTHLRDLPTSDTNQRLGKIPLVIGMPVMITQNFDVAHGVVNGSRGILTRIRYTVDPAGNRHATSCVVHIPDMVGPPLEGLPEKHATVMEDKVKMQFTHPHSLKKCTIERTQLPIVPAFAMTAHKSQGQTLAKVVIDLEGCRGTEAPYVMLSRAKSLDGVFILRPFNIKRVQSRPSEESRTEFKCLEILRLRTIAAVGTRAESDDAKEMLKRVHLTAEASTFDSTLLQSGGRELRRMEQDIESETARLRLEPENTPNNMPPPQPRRRNRLEPASNERIPAVEDIQRATATSPTEDIDMPLCAAEIRQDKRARAPELDNNNDVETRPWKRNRFVL